MKRFSRASFVAAALLVGSIPASGSFAQEAGQPVPEVPTATTTPETATPAPEQTVPQQSVEERLLFLLSGYEYFPTREDLDEVAKADVVVAALLGFAADEDRRNTLRLRAIDALGLYDHPDAVAYLGALVADPLDKLSRKQLRVGTLMKHHAITSLARARKEAAVPQIAPILASEDVQLRLTAISALGKHGGRSGRAALSALQKTEKSDFVQRELRKWVR